MSPSGRSAPAAPRRSPATSTTRPPSRGPSPLSRPGGAIGCQAEGFGLRPPADPLDCRQRLVGEAVIKHQEGADKFACNEALPRHDIAAP